MYAHPRSLFVKKPYRHIYGTGAGMPLVIPRSHEDIAHENYLASQSEIQDLDHALDASHFIVEQILAMAQRAVEAQTELRTEEAASLLV